MAASIPIGLCSTLLAMTLLAGCNSPAPAADANDPGVGVPADPVPALRTDETFGWMAGAGEPVLGVGPQVGSSNAASIEIPGNGTLEAYANWTCATPTCDLHFYLYAPGQGPGNNGLEVTESSGHEMGASPLVIRFEALEPGAWTAALFPGTPDASVDGTLQLVFRPSLEPDAGAAGEK